MKKVTVEFWGHYLELQAHVCGEDDEERDEEEIDQYYDDDDDFLDACIEYVDEGFDTDRTYFEIEGKKYEASDFKIEYCPPDEEEAKEDNLPWVFGKGKIPVERAEGIIIEEKAEELSADYVRVVYNKNSGEIEIEIPDDEEFDPSKVLIYQIDWVMPEYEIPIIRAFVYDGKAYEIDYEDGRGCGSEIVWGDGADYDDDDDDDE